MLHHPRVLVGAGQYTRGPRVTRAGQYTRGPRVTRAGQYTRGPRVTRAGQYTRWLHYWARRVGSTNCVEMPPGWLSNTTFTHAISTTFMIKVKNTVLSTHVAP